MNTSEGLKKGIAVVFWVIFVEDFMIPLFDSHNPDHTSGGRRAHFMHLYIFWCRSTRSCFWLELATFSVILRLKC